MRTHLKVIALLALFLGLGWRPAWGQVDSNVPSVILNMTVGETLSVTATPANVTFTYNPNAGGTATASGPIAVTTTWNLGGSRTSLNTYIWLSSATAALSGPANIPSSEVFAQVNSGAVTACTGTIAAAGVGASGAACALNGANSLLHWTFPGTALNSSSSDNVTLSLSGLGGIPTGSYTGTLNIEAVAI